MKFRPADIGFIMHHDNWVSRSIKWFMGSRWSHTFMIQEQTEIATYTIETDEWDVDHGELDEYDADPESEFEVWRKVDLSDSECMAIVQAARKYTLSVNYGWLQLISMAIRNLLRRIKIRIKNFFRQGVTCAGVPAYGYSKAGIEGFTGIDPEDVDTEDFYTLVKSLGFKLVYSKKRGDKSGQSH